jgi:hypothetical protein
MELTGKILVVLPSEAGQSAKGSWKKQTFVVETMEQYPKKVAFEMWGDDCRQLDDIKPGNVVKVLFNVESKEHDGRWFTTAKCWKMQIIAK